MTLQTWILLAMAYLLLCKLAPWLHALRPFTLYWMFKYKVPWSRSIFTKLVDEARFRGGRNALRHVMRNTPGLEMDIDLMNREEVKAFLKDMDSSRVRVEGVPEKWQPLVFTTGTVIGFLILPISRTLALPKRTSEEHRLTRNVVRAYVAKKSTESA